MSIVQATRRLAAIAMNIHAGRLVALVAAAERAEEEAGFQAAEAERLSRWANENKKAKRAALTEAVERTDTLAEAVAAELETLPYADPAYLQRVR